MIRQAQRRVPVGAARRFRWTIRRRSFRTLSTTARKSALMRAQSPRPRFGSSRWATATSTSQRTRRLPRPPTPPATRAVVLTQSSWMTSQPPTTTPTWTRPPRPMDSCRSWVEAPRTSSVQTAPGRHLRVAPVTPPSRPSRLPASRWVTRSSTTAPMPTPAQPPLPTRWA